ncbi:DUF6191 domain-containing protein [Streptomyces sp. SUK 48]|uniref:DUF6191 domain-containing protein n=1 Tax=Streptomyces sp. SUK 48 TaxID=2582831 RepID=UPI00129A3C5D|nr:DUF6191 domain-containing protein [Streptomyces sp. SUK 48]
MFDAFSELFTPGRKHTRDEQNRLELTREEVGDSDPGRGPIDLTSGKAVIRLSAPNPDPTEPGKIQTRGPNSPEAPAPCHPPSSDAPARPCCS